VSERLTDVEARWLEESVDSAARNRKRGKGYGWGAHATEKAIAARLFGAKSMLSRLLAERRALRAAIADVVDCLPNVSSKDDRYPMLLKLQALLGRDGGGT
jgi:hypothetical protein